MSILLYLGVFCLAFSVLSCASTPETQESEEETVVAEEGAAADEEMDAEEAEVEETAAEEVTPFGNLDNWEKNMTATIESVGNGVTVNNGVASFIQEQYSNEILQFEMSMDIKKWPAFALRQSTPGQPYWNGTNCYLIVFGAGEDTLELHKQNGEGIKQSVDNTYFESGETHTLTAGAITEEGGIRVRVFVDDTEVLNWVDEAPIVEEQGYFSVYAWETANPVTVTDLMVVDSYPGE